MIYAHELQHVSGLYRAAATKSNEPFSSATASERAEKLHSSKPFDTTTSADLPIQCMQHTRIRILYVFLLRNANKVNKILLTNYNKVYCTCTL